MIYIHSRGRNKIYVNIFFFHCWVFILLTFVHYARQIEYHFGQGLLNKLMGKWKKCLFLSKLRITKRCVNKTATISMMQIFSYSLFLNVRVSWLLSQYSICAEVAFFKCKNCISWFRMNVTYEKHLDYQTNLQKSYVGRFSSQKTDYLKNVHHSLINTIQRMTFLMHVKPGSVDWPHRMLETIF